MRNDARQQKEILSLTGVFLHFGEMRRFVRRTIFMV